MKIPKYVRQMVEQKQIAPAPLDEQARVNADGTGVYGYMFRVYKLSNAHWDSTFTESVCRLVRWARREHAESVAHYFERFTEKEHRKPYYKRDYALVTITDPVAQQLEKLIKEARKK